MADYQLESSCPRHCQMDVAVGFPLSQYSEVFRIRDANGQPYVLIGGQAVNYWAERYLKAEPELTICSPSPAKTLISKAAVTTCSA